MAETETSSSTSGIVAIFAILVMLIIAAFIAWRAGVFGGGGDGDRKSLDIDINTPSTK